MRTASTAKKVDRIKKLHRLSFENANANEGDAAKAKVESLLRKWSLTPEQAGLPADIYLQNFERKAKARAERKRANRHVKTPRAPLPVRKVRVELRRAAKLAGRLDDVSVTRNEEGIWLVKVVDAPTFFTWTKAEGWTIWNNDDGSCTDIDAADVLVLAPGLVS